MATVYLCIGTQKTGTTTLQYFMRQNEAALAKQGYCYPYMDLGFPDAQYKNRNAHFLIHQSSDQEAVKRTREKGFAILGKLAKKYQNIVLSDEIVWYKCLQIENFWEKTLEDFNAIGCSVKVVAYLRRQDELMQSLWIQKIKGLPGITQGFEEWLEESMGYFPLDYYTHLKRIEKSVGSENLIVRVYEQGQFEGTEKNLLSDYLGTVGISFDDSFEIEDDSRNENLTGNFIEIKRIINGIPEYKEAGNFLRGPLVMASKYQTEQYPQERTSLFSYEERMAFVKRFEEENRKTAEEFLGRSDGILFKKPVPDLPKWKAEPETMYRDIIIAMAEIFGAQESRIREQAKIIKAQQDKMSELKKVVKAINNSAIFRLYWKLKKLFKKDRSQ